MDENVKFRFIDSEGHVSTESRTFNFRIDRTPPTCELAYKNPDAENTWYKSDITFTFGSKEQPDSSKQFNSANIINSGELRYGITTGNILSSNKSSDVQNTDTKGITWYGYVEDKANNFTKCQTASPIKRDTVAPSCELKFAGTAGNSGWYKKGTVTISFKSATDATSDVATYGLSSYTGSHSTTRNTSTGSSGLKYTGYVKDVSGHTASCNKTLYLDVDDPWCSTSKGNLNEPEGVTVSFTCDNNVGGSGTNCPATRTEIKSSDTYTVTDVAGNSNSCGVTVYNKQQKQTKSCRTGKRCRDAGCEQWNLCTHSDCGQDPCRCDDCYYGSNTCQGGYTSHSCTGTAANCTGAGCPKCSWFSSESACEGNTGCNWTASGWSNCATGSDTCRYGCDSCDRTCRTSGCGCEYYYRNISTCGCETWGSYGNWGDDSSCTSNGEHESSDHSTTTHCRTVYY
jgi:hypothetical protein